MGPKHDAYGLFFVMPLEHNLQERVCSGQIRGDGLPNDPAAQRAFVCHSHFAVSGWIQDGYR